MAKVQNLKLLREKKILEFHPHVKITSEEPFKFNQCIIKAIWQYLVCYCHTMETIFRQDLFTGYLNSKSSFWFIAITSI